MNVLYSIDDGHESDLKSIELLNKCKVEEAIFFIPIKSWGYDNLKTYSDFEVGGHTWSHPSDLKELEDKELDVEIDQAKLMLDKRLHENFMRKTRWFCYPRGRFDSRVAARVKKAGFKFARTTRIGYALNPFEIEGYHCFQRAEYSKSSWLAQIKHAFNNALKYDTHIHIWWHSWEIDRNNDWKNLEELISYVEANRASHLTQL